MVGLRMRYEMKPVQDKGWAVREDASFAGLYRMSPVRRVEMVREGAPAELLNTVAERTGMAREELYRALGLAPSTIKRKLSRHQHLSSDESERVMGIVRLIGQVAVMLEESSNEKGFDAAAWLGRWLARPNPALGGERPLDYLDTADGRQMVSDLLGRMQSGAYS